MGFWKIDTGPGAGAGFVASRTALKALSTAEHSTAYLTEAGREGQFIWRTGNYASFVTADAQEGIYLKADDTASSSGAWVRVYSGPANVKWFGAKGDDSNDDITALQAATDLCNAVFIPNGTYRISTAWLLDTYATLHFASRQAIIKIMSTSTSEACISARGHTSFRNYFITIYSGTLRGTVDKGGPVLLRLRSASMTKVYGTFFSYGSEAVQLGGTSSLGAFYNDFFGCDMTTVGAGIRCGTLGNENKFYGGRIGDCAVGTDENDGTCNTYNGLAIEGFTSHGHRVGFGGVASQRIRFLHSRLENLGGVGTGIYIGATAESTVIMGEFYTGLATPIYDGGSGTDHIAAY